MEAEINNRSDKNPLLKGFYYSKESTHELLKIDEDFTVWILPVTLLDYPALLDYPEVKLKATGSISFGDYGLARKEIQDALKDTTSSKVGIFYFLENLLNRAFTKIRCQDHTFAF